MVRRAPGARPPAVSRSSPTTDSASSRSATSRTSRTRCCSPSINPTASMGEIFNCGDDEKLTIRQVAEIITDELDYDWELLSMPGRVRGAGSAADDELPHDPSRDGHDQVARRDSATAMSCRRARRCVVPHDGSSTIHPSAAATKRPRCKTRSTTPRKTDSPVVARRDRVEPPDLGYVELPGYGKSYAGPGTRNVRDTRTEVTPPMSLHGWSLPLSPQGRASLVPPPPWHFSGDVIGIDFAATRPRWPPSSRRR